MKVVGKNSYSSFNVIFYDEVSSTMDVCLKQALKNGINNCLVVSNVQTSGRGTKRRSWDSQKEGLWFSFVSLIENKNLAIILSVILHKVLFKYSLDIKIKWFNDIYFKDCKLAGVLVEKNYIDTSIYTICGIGINVNNKVNCNINTISLKNIVGKEVLINNILKDFVDEYEKYTINQDKLFEEFNINDVVLDNRIEYKNELMDVISLNKDFSLNLQGNRGEIFQVNYEDVK